MSFQVNNTASMVRPSNTMVRSSSSSSISDVPSTAARRPPSRTKKSKAQQASLEEGWTINQLRYKNLSIHGRKSEIRILEDCLERTCQSTTSAHRELVIISAASGCGKSTLVDAFHSEVVKRKRNGDVIFVKGKFNLERNQPYSGMLQVMDGISMKIKSLEITNPEIYETFCTQLRQSLGNSQYDDLFPTFLDRRMYFGRVNGIRNLFGSKHEIEMVYDRGNSSRRQHFGRRRKNLLDVGDELAHNKNRLHYVFNELIRIVILNIGPLVIALDDLQWSDSASLELLEMILVHEQLGCLMIIGCYRDEEVDETHLLSTTLRNIRSIQQKGNESMGITEVVLGNLNVENVNSILMDILGIDNEGQTHGLANLIHRRTDGNPLFIVSFVSMLKEKGLLEYNFGLMRWMWTDSLIEENTKATSDVVDLLKSKVEGQIQEEVGLVLKVASCLGSCFEESLVSILWDGMHCFKGSSKCTGKDPHDLLVVAMDQSFLERHNENNISSGLIYRWTHDKVKEAIIATIQPPELLRRLKVEAGEILIDQLSADELDTAIFLVCNLLNEGMIPIDRRKRIVLAEMNLQAAEKAIEFSAFDDATIYISRGIECLPLDDCWERNKELTLELYTMAVEVYNITGRVNQMEENLRIVLSQSNCSLRETLRVHRSRIDSIGIRKSASVSLALCFGVLRQMGYRFPPQHSPLALFRVVTGLLHVRKAANSVHEILDSIFHKTMDDKSSEEMKFLVMAATNCYVVGHKNQMALVVLKMIELTKKKGVCEDSPFAVSLIGVMIMHVIGDVSSGSIYAEAGLEMAKKLKKPRVEAACMNVACFHVYHWTRPFASLLNPLLKCYETSLQTGDVKIAMRAILSYCSLSIVAGKYLGSIVEDVEAFKKQTRDLKFQDLFLATDMIHKMALNIMGCSSPDISIENRANSSLQIGNIFQFGNIFNYVYIGDYENAAKLSIDRGHRLSTSAQSCPAACIEPFYRAISLFATAKGNRRYIREAFELSKVTKKFAAKGNPNLQHQVLLVDAEIAVLSKQKELAFEKFRKSSFKHLEVV